MVAAVAMLSTLPAEACSCAGANVNGCGVPVADLIVRATVVAKEVDPPRRPVFSVSPQSVGRPSGAITQPEPWGHVKVTLSVSERFHGAAADTLVIRTELGTDSCGYPFEAGHEYLVFANANQGNVIVTSCSATQPSKMAVARIEQLRALRDGSTLPDLYGFVGTHPLRWDPYGWEQVQPVPDLTVTARSDGAEYRTQTADDGMYRFQELPRGRYQLSVAAPPEHKAFWGGNAERPGASPGTHCAMNFEVFWDGLIRGTVQDRDGQPASGMITAQYVGPENPPGPSLGSNIKDGRFEFPKLPPGRYRLVFVPINAGRPADAALYYPGTQVQSAATLIEVGEGEHVEGLLFTIF